MAMFFSILILGLGSIRNGTYAVTFLKPGDAKPTSYPASTPPPARLVTVIEGSRWMMRDMMVGFNGTFRVSKRVVTFVTTIGPSGKLKKPDRMVFDLSPDGRVLTGRARNRKDVRFIFTWVSANAPFKPY